MIANIRGTLIHKEQDHVVVDVGGVGYEVFIPASAFNALPPVNEQAAFFVHTHVKDDAIHLYGFPTREEREVFRLLIGVTGVGPKLGRAILSGIPVAALVAAVTAGDRAALASIPGIGAKTAERLILELKEKLVPFLHGAPGAGAAGAPARDQLSSDVVSALGNLGYRSVEAEEAVRKARRSAGAGFEALFKESLKYLAAR